jgi:hypothetical protein
MCQHLAETENQVFMPLLLAVPPVIAGTCLDENMHSQSNNSHLNTAQMIATTTENPSTWHQQHLSSHAAATEFLPLLR